MTWIQNIDKIFYCETNLNFYAEIRPTLTLMAENLNLYAWGGKKATDGYRVQAILLLNKLI